MVKEISQERVRDVSGDNPPPHALFLFKTARNEPSPRLRLDRLERTGRNASESVGTRLTFLKGALEMNIKPRNQ